MRIAPLADVKACLSAYVEQAETEGPIVITRNGKAVAVLLAPVDGDDLEGLLLARSPRLEALLEKSRRSIREGKGLSREDFWKVVDERVANQKYCEPHCELIDLSQAAAQNYGDRVSMNEELFAELLESVREGGAILRGEKAPSRKIEVKAPDVKKS